jgi:hypothetical protein
MMGRIRFVYLEVSWVYEGTVFYSNLVFCDDTKVNAQEKMVYDILTVNSVKPCV